MEFEDFRNEIMEDVKVESEIYGEGSVASFLKVFSEKMISSDIIQDDITLAFFEGEGRNKRKLRVDGYLYDDIDHTMNLYIVDYDAISRDSPMVRSLAENFFKKVQFFIEESYESNLSKTIEPSTPASDLVDNLISKRQEISKFRFHLLTTRDMGIRTISWDVKSINKIDNKTVEYQVWDLRRVFLICNTDLGRENIAIDFKQYTSKGIPCIEATGMDGNDFKSYLCIIPGDVLAQIYDDKGSVLLEGNVRSFLSTKVAVNKKIRETILRDASKFFAYNNGISATAMNLRFEKNSSGLFITYVEDFQIINGGQTTATLSSTRQKDNADLSNVFVAMKLTEIDSNDASELIRNISRSSNSQNKVSDADFFSTHQFHVRMEKYSRSTLAPATGGSQYETHWFYERARGQYFQEQMRLTAQEKKKFLLKNPKEQLVTKTDLAKYRNSWDEYPHIVSKGAQTNFMKFAEQISASWDKNENLYNEKYFKDSMALAKLFKEIEKLVTKQPWYQNGYRANIVTYSIATFHHLIKMNMPNHVFDLSYIWKKQQIPQEVLEVFTKITLFVHNFITSTASETANVTQWCKRDKCWEKMKDAIPQQNFSCNNILQFMKSKEDEKTESREAKKSQHEDNDISAQSIVVNYGCAFWQKLQQFCIAHDLENAVLEKAFYPAVRIPAIIPSPKQSKVLLEALELAKSEGFVSDNK